MIPAVEAQTPAERQLAEHTVDWLASVRRSSKAAATPPPATPAPATPAPATPAGPSLKKQKVLPGSPPPSEPEGDAESGDEWNLNKVDDCVAYLEHFMPAKEVAAAGETLDGFSRVARFYWEHLKSKRTPAEHFTREIISPKTMQSKIGRAKWLDAWRHARKQEFVQKPRK